MFAGCSQKTPSVAATEDWYEIEGYGKTAEGLTTIIVLPQNALAFGKTTEEKIEVIMPVVTPDLKPVLSADGKKVKLKSNTDDPKRFEIVFDEIE